MKLGPNWKFYAESFSGRFFYDSEDIARPSKNVFRVRSILFYSDQAKKNIRKHIHEEIEVPSEDWNSAEYSVFLVEVDRSTKKHRTLSVAYYKSGDIKFYEVTTPSHEADWFPILKGSTVEGLYGLLPKPRFWGL